MGKTGLSQNRYKTIVNRHTTVGLVWELMGELYLVFTCSILLYNYNVTIPGLLIYSIFM